MKYIFLRENNIKSFVNINNKYKGYLQRNTGFVSVSYVDKIVKAFEENDLITLEIEKGNKLIKKIQFTNRGKKISKLLLKIITLLGVENV